MYENTAMAGTQTLTLQNRRHLSLSWVKSVDAFSEQSIKLTTDEGRVTVSGEGLKVLAFSKQTGLFTAEGKVDGLRFSGAKTALVKRVFR